MPRQIQGSQTDFSFGEVDVALKRADSHPARKTGLRQMANARILNSGGLQNRPGRSALFPSSDYNRIEEVTMSPGNLFKLAFGVVAGVPTVQVRNAAGTVVATIASSITYKWTLATTNLIVFAQLGLTIYFTYPGMIPQTLSWDGVSTWASANYTEMVFGNQKRTFFYRISPQNITLLPGAQTGSGISLVASAPLFTAGHVGTRMRYVNRQMTITAVTDSTHALVTIEESLPGHQNLGIATDPRSAFSLGDVIIGSTTGSKGIVTAISAVALDVQLISTNASVVTLNYYEQRTVSFQSGETIVGPGGSIVVGSASAIDAPTIGVTFWDEEVMNAYRGYPTSVFVDQFRVGLCNFPSVPNGIGWSAINSPSDLYVGGPTVPNGAIFEVAPSKVRVQHVVPGPEGSEFVFCDHRLFYIKIDASNPLVPGSVGFQLLSGDGAALVQPRLAQDVIFYVNAGGNSVMAVTAPGAYYRPFSTINLTEFHSHLFTDIVAIAAPNADGTFDERYVYALNADGTLACGKYRIDDGKLSTIGWGPWSGGGSLKWIAATNADVLFTTSYFGSTICEILDDSQYLDASLFVNALPAPFNPPGGQGPLWWMPSQTVSLMDQVTRSMGTYDIDANGFIVPQNNGGEDLTALSLVAGQPWTMAVEPFAPDATSGADMGQRMKWRQISYFAVYIINSSGFYFAALFSSKPTRTSPPSGTVQQIRRIPAWNVDDDPTLPPTLQETVELWPPPGSSFDPRVAIIKDTPGPLLVAEFAIEISL